MDTTPQYIVADQAQRSEIRTRLAYFIGLWTLAWAFIALVIWQPVAYFWGWYFSQVVAAADFKSIKGVPFVGTLDYSQGLYIVLTWFGFMLTMWAILVVPIVLAHSHIQTRVLKKSFKPRTVR